MRGHCLHREEITAANSCVLDFSEYLLRGISILACDGIQRKSWTRRQCRIRQASIDDQEPIHVEIDDRIPRSDLCLEGSRGVIGVERGAEWVAIGMFDGALVVSKGEVARLRLVLEDLFAISACGRGFCLPFRRLQRSLTNALGRRIDECGDRCRIGRMVVIVTVSIVQHMLSRSLPYQ